MSLNKALLIGNLGNDPEARSTPSGQSVTNFNIATTRRWRDNNGEMREETEWHRIVVWGRQAETCKEYLKKGRQVFIEGRIQTRQWEDKEGNKKYTTEVIAQNVQFLGGGGGGGRGAADHSSQAPAAPAADSPPAFSDTGSSGSDDDIPF